MNAAKLHFISGKGGTGKSSFAASLSLGLAQDPKNLPILTIDVQGSGHMANLIGIENPAYLPRPSLRAPDLWSARIFPQESFQEYFTRALYPGSEQSFIGEATAGLREKIVSTAFSNSIVRSFVEVCPGLEPSAMLGKIHFECTEGLLPETNRRWRHVIVDAPSTGHFLALFSSIEALTRVFSAGVVLKQASQIHKFMIDHKHTQIYLITLPSQLPVQETLELKENLKSRGLKADRIIVNRAKARVPRIQPLNDLSADWKNFLEVENVIQQDEEEIIADLRSQLKSNERLLVIPELGREELLEARALSPQQLGALL